ncbi:MAG: DUF2339 domain-containing protein [Bernardetiaceae bacterium]|nr:DUF2339 domain-containing protein [Bernardetiaceae bacterium]
MAKLNPHTEEPHAINQDLLRKLEEFEQEQLRQDIESFKADVEENYLRHKKEQPAYSHIKKDLNYRIMLHEGSLKEQYKAFKERARILQEAIPTPEEVKTADDLRYGAQVYLKAFAERKARSGPHSRGEPTEKTWETELQRIVDQQKNDFETLVGEKLMSRLGVLMLVIGIIFFINYGVAEGFIGAFGQVMTGFISGSIVLIISNRMRRKGFQTFSTLLLLAGMGLLYYTSFLFNEVYDDLTTLIISFGLNLAVTGVIIGISLYYNRRDIGLLAIIAGYITAFIVYRYHPGNYAALFTYLLILAAISLAIAHFKQWITLNTINFFVSILIFFGWVLTHSIRSAEDYHDTALLFGSLYYVVFFTMNVLYSLRNSLSLLNYYMMHINTLSYVITVFIVLRQTDSLADFGWHALALCAFNSFYAYILYRQSESDLNFFYTVLSYSIIFFTISAPLVAGVQYMNLFFLAESLLLLYVGLRTQTSVIQKATIIVMGLALISLVIDWYIVYGNALTQFFWNAATFASFITVVGLVIGFMMLLKRDKDEPLGFLNCGGYRIALIATAGVVVLLTGNLEFMMHETSNFSNEYMRKMFLGMYNTVFIVGLWFLLKYLKIDGVKRNVSWAVVFVALLYFFLGHPSAANLRDEHLTMQGMQSALLADENLLFDFFFHYITVGLCSLGLYFAAKDNYKDLGPNAVEYAVMVYLAASIITIYGTFEVSHWYLLVSYDPIENNDISVILRSARLLGFTFFWAGFSSMVVWLGTRFKIKELRRYGLVLFIITIIKFYIMDFGELEIVGKIISFLAIGLMLVVIGFRYNRIKKAVIESELAKTFGKIKNDDALKESKKKPPEPKSKSDDEPES